MTESTQSALDLAAAVRAAEQRCRELEATLAQREAELRTSEARCQTFVDHTTDGLYLHDSQGRVVDVNRRACESLGYERDELIGMSPTEFDPNVSPADVERFLERLSTGETIAFDTRHRRKDGSEFPVEVRIRPLWVDGQLHALALACDITDRKRAEVELRASEARYRTFVDHTTDGLFLHERSGRVVDINEQACKSLGYRREELIGMMPSDFDPDVTPALIAERMERLDAGETIAFDSHHRRKDGSVFPVEVRIRPFWMDGQFHALSLACDITERKRAEAKLQASEARYRSFVDHAPIGMFLQERDGRVVDVNRQACESLGYERDELIGMTPGDFDPEITPARCQEIIERLDDGETVAFDSHHRRKDGSVFPVEVRICPFWADGERQLLALARDITEHKQTQDQLRESEERFRALIECCTQAVWETGPDGELISDSPSWRAYTGQTVDQWWSDRWLEAVHPEDREYAYKQWHESIRNVAQVNAEFRIRHGDNDWRWTNVRAAPLLQPDGSVRKWVGMNINITERKEAEEALRESEQRFRAIFDQAIAGIAECDTSGRILSINDHYCEMLGYTRAELLELSFQDFTHPDDLERSLELFQALISGGPDFEIEKRYFRKDGLEVWVNDRVSGIRDAEGRLSSAVCICINITDWKQAEEELAVRQAELLHASRLTTVGRMVAALSHEVAQPLAAIGNFAAASDQILGAVVRGAPDTVGPGYPDPAQEPVASFADHATADPLETLRAYIQAIAKQNQRCGAILERLRDFSQRTAARRSSCDIDHLLHDSVALVSNELRRHDVEVRFDLARGLPQVVGDRVQLQQVVVNLLTNARDAVRDQASERRVITIRARAEEETVLFEVEDFGTGFSELVAEHLFEPFYTTKQGGMGIGLSICHSIIKDHHGQIEASSRDAGGATFRVQLPLPRKDDDD